MNFLAHIYLAQTSPELIVGSILGDFVKGTIGNEYPEGVKKGIKLHRKIDFYADSHMKTLACRNLISSKRRRFAGIIVDLCYDHFLSKHWMRYAKVDLASFIAHAYDILRRYEPVFPDRLRVLMPRMIRENWLGAYKELSGVERALNRMAGRIRRVEKLTGSIEEIKLNYQEMETNFLAFFPDLENYVKFLKKDQI
jgi:acyl carrier protein phosphodiesterase